MQLFDAILAAVAALAGAVASVAGFGVGSLLTPTLAMQTGTKAAVAAVTIPHMVATSIRFWQLRTHVDWKVVKSFGLTSAAGGLLGALMHGLLQSAALTAVLALLLIFAGAAGITGFAERMRFGRAGAWIAGAVSGLFGGLVGNQGGIRSAAMLGFNVRRDAFVATATAVALLVDAARLPVYLYLDGAEMLRLWPQIACMTAGVVIGTLLGKRLLQRIPETAFRRVLGVLILLLGVWMGFRAYIEWSESRAKPVALVLLTMTTKATFPSEFQPGEGGKTTVYMARWINTCGEKGPWSEIFSATVAAQSSGSVARVFGCQTPL